MKIATFILSLALLGWIDLSAQDKSPEKKPEKPVQEPVKDPSPPETEIARQERIFKAYGWFLGSLAKEMELTEKEKEWVLSGMRLALDGKTNVEDKGFMQEMGVHLSNRVKENKMKTEETFFTELAKDETVKKTNSGLYYKILKEGEGDQPQAEDVVKLHYEGKLIDGTVFDSSLKRGTPASFPVSGVIAGFKEGIMLLKEGGRVKLYIPGKLAYGERPPPGSPIKPNETLIFEVELIKINPEEK